MTKKRNFLKVTFLSVLFCVIGCSTFVSCKDYDDDIKNLQEQIDNNKDVLAKLQDLVNKGAVVTKVESDEAGGIYLTLSDGSKHHIAKGEQGVEGLPGTTGVNGKTPIFSVQDGVLNYRFAEDGEWIAIPGGKLPKVTVEDFDFKVDKDGNLTLNGEFVKNIKGETGDVGIVELKYDEETGILSYVNHEGKILEIGVVKGPQGEKGDTPTFVPPTFEFNLTPENVLQVRKKGDAEWIEAGNIDMSFAFGIDEETGDWTVNGESVGPVDRFVKLEVDENGYLMLGGKSTGIRINNNIFITENENKTITINTPTQDAEGNYVYVDGVQQYDSYLLPTQEYVDNFLTIQSLVFVPTYDGKHPFYYLYNDERVYGRTEMSFRVSPVQGANLIEKAWADDPASVQFIVDKKLMTRAASPELTITAIKNDNGLLVFSIDPPKGFAFDASYPVALHVKNSVFDVTSDYTTVQSLQLNYIQVIKGNSYSNSLICDIAYTDRTDFKIDDDFSVGAMSPTGDVARYLWAFGFDVNFTVSKINDMNVNSTDADVQAAIEEYKTNNPLELVGVGGKYIVRMKADQLNKSEHIGKNYKFTLKDLTSGKEGYITYTVIPSVSTSDNVMYDVALNFDPETYLVAPPVLEYRGGNDNAKQVFTLNKNLIDDLDMIGGTTLAEKIALLQAGLQKSEIKDETGRYVDVASYANAPEFKLDDNGKVTVTLPQDAPWKNYELKYTYVTSYAQTFTIYVQLPLSYPVATLMQRAVARWDNDRYFVEYKPTVKGFAMTLDHTLVGYSNAEFMTGKGFSYTFELQNPNNPPVNSVPTGVEITDGVITFTEYVDPENVKIKTIVKDAAGNLVDTGEGEYGITITYPVNTQFEDIAPAALVFPKESIVAQQGFNPWTNNLQLKDRYGNALMADGALTTGDWTTTYTLTDLHFELCWVEPNTVDPNNITVNKSTGEITFSQSNLTQDVKIKVLVSSKNQFGISTRVYEVTLSNTNL